MKIITFIKSNKSLFGQLSLIFIAFMLMVFISDYFGSRIVNRHIANYGNEVIHAAAETFKTYAHGHEITLNDIAFVIEEMNGQGKGAVEMDDELVLWSNRLREKDERFSEYLFLYGVVNDVFICCTDWAYPDEYNPETREWYTGALEQDGEIFYSDPYISEIMDDYVLTLSKLLYDRAGEPFGVIALDVLLTSVSGYIQQMRFLNSGYGIMLDSKGRFVVHPTDELFGVPIESLGMGQGVAEIAEMLRAGQEISAFNYSSALGDENVGFFNKLFNGWYIGLVLSAKDYYSDVVLMRLALTVTGLAMALLLCGVLTLLYVGKNRSDLASKIKSDFLANMSHEIRTPMNAIIGMAELMQHEQLSMRQRDYINDINTSAHSLLDIINDILDLSKIESGKLTLNLVNYDFHALIDNVTSMFVYVAQKKDVEFRYETVGEVPRTLYGDDIRLRQVLTNLCGNAVKYTEKGYVRLKLTAADDLLVFEIKDTGIGIPEEAMPRIFTAFEQSKTDKTRGIVGTGLGLAISKAFIGMMGGNIMIDSEYGQGTVITVMVPLVPGVDSEVKHEDAGKSEQTIYAPGARILVVDDNEFNLKVAYGLLGLFGIDAQTVYSGREAVDIVTAHDFDIVFMDHMMPEMDGVETTIEIRRLGGKYRSLPIIALTANAVQGAKEMFLANGFDDFISKPIDMDELNEMLIEWLPQEKIILKEKGAVETDDESDIFQRDIWDAINKISDINAEIGLSRVSGIESMYYENLQLFTDRLMPECRHLSTCLTENNINAFKVSVHSMKSTLSTVGAMKLSETAYNLETAAKSNNLLYCLERFPYFMNNLTSLHKELSVVFPATAAAVEKKPGEPAILSENLQKAIDAADDFDVDAGIETVDGLLEYDFGADNNALLEEASAAFRAFDYDAATEYLRKIVV